jgi:NitT/TauT family transport system permease protein
MSGKLRGEVMLGVVPVALLLAFWQGLAALGVAPPSLLPAPFVVLRRFGEQLVSPLFLAHAATTLLRLFVGFALAAAIGVTAALAAVASNLGGAVVTPLVRVLAPVPKIALYPALVLTLGFEHASKVALVAADAVFPILLATHQGMAAVEPKLVWSALAAGASRRRVLLTVVLWAALPSVLTGCRIGLVIASIVVFLAEMISSSDGLGHLLIYAARSFQTVDMFVPLLTIAVLGLALNAGFSALSARLLVGFESGSER